VKRKAILFVLLGGMLIAFSGLTPQTASAGFLSPPEFDSVVPCGKSTGSPEEMAPCSPCHFIILIQRLSEFATFISLFFLVLGLMISGGMLVVSSVNAELRGRAKDIIKITITGFLLVSFAYLLINLIFWAMGRENAASSWGDYSCSTTQP
jgi:hypothetical protein